MLEIVFECIVVLVVAAVLMTVQRDVVTDWLRLASHVDFLYGVRHTATEQCWIVEHCVEHSS